MLKANWITLLILGTLQPLTGLADDAKTPSTSSATPPAITASVEKLLAESKYASPWQLPHPVGVLTHSDYWSRPIGNFEFHDDNAIERARNLHNLSLLTLAEFHKTRLFLGVSEEGLLGLHFSALPRYDDEHYMEVVRMPYLKINEPRDKDVLQVPESRSIP